MKKILKGIAVALALMLVSTPCAILFAGCGGDAPKTEEEMSLIFADVIDYTLNTYDGDYTMTTSYYGEGELDVYYINYFNATEEWSAMGSDSYNLETHQNAWTVKYYTASDVYHYCPTIKSVELQGNSLLDNLQEITSIEDALVMVFGRGGLTRDNFQKLEYSFEQIEDGYIFNFAVTYSMGDNYPESYCGIITFDDEKIIQVLYNDWGHDDWRTLTEYYVHDIEYSCALERPAS